MSARSSTSVASPNIALAKYWGKRGVPGNVPATPSVSITLSGLTTRTSVTFDDDLEHDVFVLGGNETKGTPLERVTKLLDELRAHAETRARARVVSDNDFPTASGLASSASGFAALARAATKALGLSLDDVALSRVARRASASAARSIFGGFVGLGTEDDAAAMPLASSSHWELRVVVAAVTTSAKPISSTTAMERTRTSSPYYEAWVADAPELAREVREAVLARDLERLGVAAEASALRMHACALAAGPGIVYWTGRTLELIETVRSLRKEGIAAYFTIDAGPHVKVLCDARDAETVELKLRPLAVRTIITRPGEGARTMDEPS